jgi:hypothetical protein
MNKKKSTEIQPSETMGPEYLFPFVKQIGFCTSQIDDFRATVAVFLHNCALFAIIRIRNALTCTKNTASSTSGYQFEENIERTTADNASTLKRAIVAFVADASQSRGANVRIAHDALA